jgi:hypothetical protein
MGKNLPNLVTLQEYLPKYLMAAMHYC